MKVTPKILLADNISLEVSENLARVENLAHPENIYVMVYYDAPAGNFISARIQKNLIDFAKKFNLKFLQGHGIGYYHLDAKEGDVFVSCGNQNSILGANGAYGYYVDEDALIQLLETGEYELATYENKHVKVVGKGFLKNACFNFVKEHMDSYQNCILELVGNGFSLQEKRDVCQILSKVCVCARFVNAYDGDFDTTLDLGQCSEMIIAPSGFAKIEPLDSYLNKELDACFIGGCTGGSIEDLRLAASIWNQKKIPLHVRVCVAPATNEVFLQAIDEGLLEIFIDAGAQILNAGCGSCVTTSKGVLGSNEIMLATSMHNEAGCNGQKDSFVYLADTATVAKSALAGKIVRG